MRQGWLFAAGLLTGCGGPEDLAAFDYAAFPRASDIVIDKITWYQGVEKVLYLGPGQFGGGQQPPPIVLERDAMVRVAVSALDEYHPNAREVAVVLETTSGGVPTSHRSAVVHSGSWEEASLRTTAVFPLPGEFVTADLELNVSVHEVTPTFGGGNIDETGWSSAAAGLDFRGSNVQKLVIVPIKYLGDGSGRLPDTSPERIAEIAVAYHAMFPVSGLEVEVRPPFAWVPQIEPFSGWEDLVAEISSMRQTADVPPNTYFYGLFDPAPTLAEFCGAGCIAGMSNLATNAVEPWMRASVGLGFDGTVISTLVHEVGHAHGRDHAPCELGAQSADPAYPYLNARLGSWGYDLGTQSLVDPYANADMMSYCSPSWVSDYTFNALLDRIEAVNARSGGPTSEWQRLLVDGEGEARLRGTLRAGPRPGGEPATFELIDERGEAFGQVEGWLVPYSHMPGGTALVASLDPRTVKARLLP